MSVTVQSKSSAPAKVAPSSRQNHLYCEAPACSYAWAQDSIEDVENNARYVFVRIEGVPHVSYFCASCHAALTDDEKRNVPIFNDNLVNSVSLSRLERLDSYRVLLTNVKTYMLPLACIVLFLPILGPLLAFGGGRCRLPARLRELWPHLPKGHVGLTFFLLSTTYVGIALCFPFTSQCVFWGLLEGYSVLFSLVNILTHTNINGYVNVSDSLRRNRNPFIQLQYAMFRALCSGGVPVLGLLELLLLISAPPLATVVYSSSKRLTDPTDLNALSLLDSTTQEPIDPSFLPGVFVSRPIQRRIVGIMGWRRFTLLLGLVASVAINGLLTASWVGGVIPSFDFVVPGAYALVSSPANAMYGMSGELAARSCASTTIGLSTTSSVVWNLGFEPAPTVDVGLPLVTLFFSNHESVPVPFTVETAWNIQLVNQSGSHATFYPLPKEAYFSLRANFDGDCTAVRALRPVATVYYATSSLQMYVAAQTLDVSMVFFPVFLLLKQIAQCGVFSICIGGLSGRIWALWIKFDSISSVGLYPHFGTTPLQVDLGCRTNLIAWMAVRRSVIGATHLFTSFVKPLLSLALVQLAIAFGGLLVYALTGTAPMPTYFLLVLAVVSSISTLVFLYPLSEAMEIQANHGDMLREVQLQHLLKKGANDTDDGVGDLLAVYVDIVDNHDDRITFWGTETSKEKLQGLVVTLASGLSFIGSKTVQYEWSTLNPYYDYVGNNIPHL
ncbi:hypothetical protein SPRG_19577 [Saprolegnia parasitica CBS 223.65]|uniref:Transmembrane protein n=1 Tax=Saprolegnia parasitica (strain CBS 223.65) TaxID=695850 RepID=A0A067CJY4_SAPPC|nr:hypothetical protein SPRG_19577 [Saprolegnia parasitica CBS 223.65]KDO31049.1 hypothetical protein SPRG_19577 [Saprolegnia parasitica CBS 223.65]|eukprot:XP_012198310.1 hypothetical protein SPRG_19577 [Saprolegnia parasitica CBS 223.65]